MEKIADWQWYDFEEVGSTNDTVKNFCTEAGKKIVVTAQSQNNGRGRRGRSWVGLEGNLFMSMALEVPLHELGQVIFVVTLAMLNSIKKLAPQLDVKLKWPNDVLVNGCKISGILLEKASGDYLVIGIGVNIAAYPEIKDIVYKTTSLRQAGCETDRITFLKTYLWEFDDCLAVWRQEGFPPVREQWLSAAAHLGGKIRVNGEKESKEGIFEGVDNNGMLLLNRNGNVEKIYAGDIFYL